MNDTPSWPDIDVLARGLSLPAGMRARQLSRADIPSLVEALARWHPNLVEAEDAELLSERFYTEHVALAGETRSIRERPSFVVVIEREDELLSCVINELDPAAQLSLGRFSIVAPEARRQGLGRAHVELQTAIARAAGAKATHGFTELDNLGQCTALLRTGHTLSGLLPDADWRPIEGRGVRCVSEAAFFFPLVPASELAWPLASAMRPATAGLMKLVYDHGSPSGPSVSFAPEPIPRLELSDPDPSRGSSARVAEGIAKRLGLAEGLRLRRLERGDLPSLSAELPAWRIDLAHGDLARDPLATIFAAELGARAPAARVRASQAWVLERDDQLLGLSYAACELERSSLFPEFLATAGERGASSLAELLLRAQILTAQALELETITVHASLQHLRGQALCERSGFRLVGLSPASERIARPSGGMAHGFEAVYSISLVDPELRYLPRREAMPGEVARLVDFVFGASSSRP